ncbi:hypothetical protein GY45DRAFT_418124 [Cubamyces sp. BRFM 1775]|nr:hypothetical protein GY45DRAFT_418124 [Cubamyces sp. BRFM 1775]
MPGVDCASALQRDSNPVLVLSSPQYEVGMKPDLAIYLFRWTTWVLGYRCLRAGPFRRQSTLQNLGTADSRSLKPLEPSSKRGFRRLPALPKVSVIMSATKIRTESGCLIILAFNPDSRVLSNNRRLSPRSGHGLRQLFAPGLLQTSTSLIPTPLPFHFCPGLGAPGFQNTGALRIGYLCIAVSRTY